MPTYDRSGVDRTHKPRRRAPIDVALRRHADALASIEVAKRRIARLEALCATLDAEIVALGGWPKPRKPRLDFRANGEMQRTMFDLLREKKAVTAADLAAALAPSVGIAADDKKSMWALRQRALQCFRRNERKGIVRQRGWSASVNGRKAHGRFVVWELAL